ncbi:MAG: hypothetical protein A3I29_00560 [Candidatus Magasanikbacteria bacterium RIFCSPLOWO2_02_FULL_44_11]|uniref:Nudix hydrolase domain-containing protein n=1 Tax=Candidatus Magasanikbacteria bacterium RIFCSPLOWO2_02_FULL_44_11 TaxID=1798689 RepID=A0A1F6N8Z7_9BACT|nr:MAG: hypothetical protein A3I29_00560 [Candidatus Magasanikbacteria bacterium RIFCSPLOWO2_02_FULL_44_11]
MSKAVFGNDKVVYNGIIFKIHRRIIMLPNGRKKMIEYCERPNSVSVLAFNKKNELLMIREHRPGYKHNVWFLPGGRMDKAGESPKQAALRELREETGFGAKKMKLIQKKSPSGTLLWNIYIYSARDLYWQPLDRDPGEFIKFQFVPFKKAVQMALDGTIENEFISYNIIRFNEMLKRKEFKW